MSMTFCLGAKTFSPHDRNGRKVPTRVIKELKLFLRAYQSLCRSLVRSTPM